MSCSRCSGCMVEDFLLDMEDSSGPMWLKASRCMNCGNIVESMLQHNCQAHNAKLLAGTTDASSKNTETVSLGAEAMAHLAA